MFTYKHGNVVQNVLGNKDQYMNTSTFKHADLIMCIRSFIEWNISSTLNLLLKCLYQPKKVVSRHCICVIRDIDVCLCFYNFANEFWNCSDRMVYFVRHFFHDSQSNLFCNWKMTTYFWISIYGSFMQWCPMKI